jgi:hypothetical protein
VTAPHVDTYQKILALAADGPPAPSLLPWLARGAAEGDLPHIARLAAAQTALAAMRRWPAVTDATAEVLAVRGTGQPELLPRLAEVLPPVMAYLDEARAAELVRAGVRADAAAYAALRHTGGQVARPTPESLHPLWQQVLAAQRTGLPPLANLRLLAELAGGVLDPAHLSPSEVVYLLPFLGADRAGEAGAQMAVAEITDSLGPEGRWYAAALFARTVPYLDDSRRSEVTGGAVLPAEWSELFERLAGRDRSVWKSAVPEIAAAHPALAELDRLADAAADEDLARACAEIAGRMPVDPELKRWEPAPAAPEPIPLERPRLTTVAAPDREHGPQVTLGGPGYEVGGGERAELPGLSTRYRLLKFACPRCSTPQYRTYYDERDLPVCHEDGDVPMRFQG